MRERARLSGQEVKKKKLKSDYADKGSLAAAAFFYAEFKGLR